MTSATKLVSVLALASALAACASTGQGLSTAETPTSQYRLEARPDLQEVALAPRADGLSQAQRAALGDIALRANGAPIVVRAPAGGDAVSTRSAFNAKEALMGMGARDVRLASYDAAPGAPILVGFTGYAAVVPDCGRWDNLTATGSNQVHSNFGCAVTANMAAQIANPADIANPQPMDPTDAQRRSTVMDRYRKGELTAAQHDQNSSGAVSRVVP
ncbi:MAG: CpaD family pilus assembly protein [Caulobacteraceae bacterium]|nr:CpaD family pilus assembly protein [Caulobacteraceae bacterium]